MGLAAVMCTLSGTGANAADTVILGVVPGISSVTMVELDLKA